VAATSIEQLKREALAGAMPPTDMDTVRMLKAYGHDMAKAFEIELDARRGDKHAVAWVELARTFPATVEGRTP
jgi:hypothetical protein